jgi:hypothetical protein
MKTLALFLFGALAPIFSSLQASAQTPSGVQIQYVRTQGSGCQNGTARAMLTPDGRAFSVFMDNYIAETTNSLSLDYKTCNMEIGIAIPAGYSFSLLTADYRGFVNAEAGTQVSHQVLYTFDGSRPPNERPGFGNSAGRYSFEQKIFQGPINQDYFIRNVIDPRASLWSPCSTGGQQPLMIQTFLIARAMSRGGQSQISLDSVDGALEQQFSWTWRQCNPSGGTPARPPAGGLPGRGGDGRRPPPYRPPGR